MTADPTTPDTGLQLTVVGGNPTNDELAAVSAVIARSLEELAADIAENSAPGVSAWQRSQRPIRQTIVGGATSWRGFSG